MIRVVPFPVACAAGIVVFACAATPSAVRAAEDVEAFLKGLRARGYYELVFEYLDSLKSRNRITSEQRDTIPYERALTYLAKSRAQRDQDFRSAQLDKAQEALKVFVAKRGDHPMATLARGQLANVLVERARMNLTKADKVNSAAAKTKLLMNAREHFDEAHQVYTELESDLHDKLKEMPKHVDPNKDPQTHALLTKYRQEYLESRLRPPTIVYEKVSTVAPDSKEREKWLNEAASAFGEVYQNYRKILAGHYALLHEARCYQDLGKSQDALAIYSELIAEEDNSLAYRKLKTKSLQLAIEVWISESQKNYAEAILQGSRWFARMRPGEARSAEWQAFRLALAQAHKAQADAFLAENPRNPAIPQHLAEARTHARQVARGLGPSNNQAKQLLAELVNGDEASTAVADPTTFEEARMAGWEALQLAQTSTDLINVLDGRLRRIKSPEKRREVESQKNEALQKIEETHAAALQFYLRALSLADDTTAQDDVNRIRSNVSYLHYQQKEYYDAVVHSEFVFQRFPSSAMARRCAKIALASWVNLSQQARKNEDDDLRFESEHLQRIAESIVNKLPNTAEAQDALVMLIHVAIAQDDLDAAERSLNRIAEDSPRRGVTELKTGQALLAKYLADSKQLQNRQQADPPPTAAEVQEVQKKIDDLRERARKTLEKGVERTRSLATSPALAAAVLSLAHLYLETQQANLAIALLEDPQHGSLALVENNQVATGAAAYAEETFKTALRAYIAALSEAGRRDASDQLMQKAEHAMDQLEQLVGDSKQGQKRLIGIYVSLAGDLERQIRSATAGSKRALAEGFERFLNNVVERADDIKILNWSAEMLFTLGQTHETGGGRVAGDAERCYSNALTTYKNILRFDSTLRDPNMDMHINIRMATIHRRLGSFSEAINLFEEMLQERNSSLPAQVEAALTYQEWAEAKDSTKYLDAIQGKAMKKGSRRKVIWGWATIAKKTSSNVKFVDKFHQARYNVALCRYRYALAQNGTKRTSTLKLAKRDINWTVKAFPDTVSDQWRVKYDGLLKQIQKALGEKPDGLVFRKIR